MNSPCAAHGWTSYRYAGRYGTIMIGATSTQDALNEADRSLTQGAATVPAGNLERPDRAL